MTALLRSGPVNATIPTLLASAAMAQALLAAALLLLRDSRQWAYLPLAGLFVVLALIGAPPLVGLLLPHHQVMSTVSLLPAYLALGPLLWLYVVALTQPTVWRPVAQDGRHFVPVVLALVLVVMAAQLPSAVLDALILQGDDQPVFTDADRSALSFAGYLVLFAFALVLFWLVQSALYLFFVLRRLIRYRAELKALFASNERRELGWVVGIVVTTGGLWLLSAVSLVLDNFAGISMVTPVMRSWVVFLAVFLLAIWGLRQKPGFEGRYLSAEQVEAASKYERSALDAEQSQRLAEKLEVAMKNDQLYLEPGLSLTSLAAHIGTLPNYVSQTLNETLQQSFFDYVNAHRIDAAKRLLVDGDDSIIDVAYAVGFNSRSAFYAAFRKTMGQTPGAFRKNARSD